MDTVFGVRTERESNGFTDVGEVYPEFTSDFVTLVIPELKKLGAKYTIAIMTQYEYELKGTVCGKETNRSAR